MDNELEKDLDNDFFMSKRKSEKIKENLLDEEFKKAKTGKFTVEKKLKEKNLKKKPFFLFGIVLIIIGAGCFVTINYGPHLYVNYTENVGNENVTIEKIYYKGFQYYDLEDENINSFFNEGSEKYLGVSIDDLTSYNKLSIYISYALILIGIIFTVIQIISKIRCLGYRTSLVLHSFFAAIIAVICTYLIFTSIKFFSALLLFFLNYNIISDSLRGPLIVFVAPIIILFVVSGSLKICFLILKGDYYELQGILESKSPKKSLFDFRYRGGKK